MDMTFSAEYEALRSEINAFLGDNAELVAELSDQSRTSGLQYVPRFPEFAALAVAAGYYGRNMPRRYGGAERPYDAIAALIIREEFGQAGLPDALPGMGPRLLAPTLLAHGNDWQKEVFLPPTMAMKLHWCQGYSEPEAGSDLASLCTRAELDGDEWVINGQKVWTTGAQHADYMFCLCRTEPGALRHEGISYIIIDMKQPGVEVRPLRQLTGDSEFNEVFLTDARAPLAHLVGQRGAGWKVAMTTLGHERASMGAGDGTYGRQVEALWTRACTPDADGLRAIDDAGVARDLCQLEARAAANQFTQYRILSQAAAGQGTRTVSIMSKLVGSEIFQDIARCHAQMAATDLLETPAGFRLGSVPGNPAAWNALYLRSLGYAIAGGTSNIQRRLVAERGLGLPR